MIVAEGARDRDGNPISSDYVKSVLEECLGHDTRVTILGHVQRGGSPPAFDRNLSTMMGRAAVDEVLDLGFTKNDLTGTVYRDIIRLGDKEYQIR